jgi:hypothetical protein
MKKLLLIPTFLLLPLIAQADTQEGWLTSFETALKKREYAVVQLHPKENPTAWTILPINKEKGLFSKNSLPYIDAADPQKETPLDALSKKLRATHGEIGRILSRPETFVLDRQTLPSEILADEIVDTIVVKKKKGPILAKIEELP